VYPAAIPVSLYPRLRSSDSGSASSEELVSGIVRSNQRLLRTQRGNNTTTLYFEGEQEEGVEVEELRTDEALQEVWKIEPQHVAFQREGNSFVKLGQGGSGNYFKKLYCLCTVHIWRSKSAHDGSATPAVDCFMNKSTRRVQFYTRKLHCLIKAS
jgi:hypothetical protein